MPLILDGKKVRDSILDELKKKISTLETKPRLVIIQVGNRAESTLYIQQKKKYGEKIGVEVRHVQFEANVSEERVQEVLRTLNEDTSVNGILLQLPLPKDLNKETLIEMIDPHKDVDGLHSENMKNLLSGKKGLIPATAKGILRLLDAYSIQVSGKKVLVIGASMLVGKPIALHLLNYGATVTVAHRKTLDIPELSKISDIIIVAAGSPRLVTKAYVVPEQTIIDIGISLVEGKLVGDVAFDEVSKIVAAITPVPGGVGPMTIACLFENVLEAYQLQQKT